MFYSFFSCSCSFSVLLFFVPVLFLFSELVKLSSTFPMTDELDRDSRRQLVVMGKKKKKGNLRGFKEIWLVILRFISST